MSTSQPANSIAPFLPTSIYFPEEFLEFRIKILETYRNISNTVNTRQISIFDFTENLTGEQWPVVGNPQSKRQPYRKVISTGAIATGATATLPHGIASISAFTHIFGTCVTDVVDYRPIPYSSVVATNQQIQLTVTATNVVIVNGAASPNITSGFVVLEYLK